MLDTGRHSIPFRPLTVNMLSQSSSDTHLNRYHLALSERRKFRPYQSPRESRL